MRVIIAFIFIVGGLTIFDQDQEEKTTVNHLFELKVDSIEKRISIYKWGTDTNYYLHYSVANLSQDTLYYITNSCFYYNHYLMKLNDQEFDLNPEGGCYGNSHDIHSLKPGDSFSEAEDISATNINRIMPGNWNTYLRIPLVSESRGYRVDGRVFIKDNVYLTYSGVSSVVEVVVDHRKKKRKRIGF